MGITNQALSKSLIDLVELPIEKIHIGFISTAASPEPGDKDWFIGQITDLQKFGFKWIDIIDFSAPGTDWKNRLEAVNVIFVSGGNTYHLLNQSKLCKFDNWLKEHIDKYVYVGSSAGSIILTPNIGTAGIEPADTNYCKIYDLTALNIVPFEIAPHSFGWVTPDSNADYAKTTPNKVYAIDDATGVMVKDHEISVVSEGRFEILNT